MSIPCVVSLALATPPKTLSSLTSTVGAATTLAALGEEYPRHQCQLVPTKGIVADSPNAMAGHMLETSQFSKRYMRDGQNSLFFFNEQIGVGRHQFWVGPSRLTVF